MEKKRVTFFGWAFIILGILGVLHVATGIVGAFIGIVTYYSATPAQTAARVMISNTPFVLFYISSIVIGSGLLHFKSLARKCALLFSYLVISFHLLFEMSAEPLAYKIESGIFLLIYILIYGSCIYYLTRPKVKALFNPLGGGRCNT